MSPTLVGFRALWTRIKLPRAMKGAVSQQFEWFIKDLTQLETYWGHFGWVPRSWAKRCFNIWTPKRPTLDSVDLSMPTDKHPLPETGKQFSGSFRHTVLLGKQVYVLNSLSIFLRKSMFLAIDRVKLTNTSPEGSLTNRVTWYIGNF